MYFISGVAPHHIAASISNMKLDVVYKWKLNRTYMYTQIITFGLGRNY